MRTLRVSLGVFSLLAMLSAGKVHAYGYDREILDRVIGGVRESQRAVQYRDEYRARWSLDSAQRELSRISHYDFALEQAQRALYDAGQILNSYLPPYEKARRFHVATEFGIRRIYESQTYNGGRPYPPDRPDRPYPPDRPDRPYPPDRPDRPNPPPYFGTVDLGSFTKSSFDPERFQVNISRYTQGRSFSQVGVRVSAGERGFTVIINTILVRVNGQWQQTAVGSRMREGITEYHVNIPQGATDILFSLDHGKGSTLQAWMK